MNKVVITGIGMITPYGIGFDSFAAGLKNQTPVYEPITLCDTTDSKIKHAGQSTALHDAPLKNRKIKKLVNRKDLLALAAVHDAWLQADLDNADLDPTRAGAYVGACSTQIGDFFPYFDHVLACVSEDRSTFDSSRLGKSVLQDVNPIVALKVLSNGTLAHMSQTYNLQGPNTNVMNFGTAGMEALLHAADAIATDQADLCIVTSMYAPFDPFQLADGVIQNEWSQNFASASPTITPYTDSATGTLPTEASVAIVLESAAHATRRQAKPLAQMASWSQGASGAQADASGLRVALGKLGERPAQILGCGHGSNTIDRWERECTPSDSTLHSIYGFFGYPAEVSGLIQLAASLAASTEGCLATPFGTLNGAEPVLLTTLNRFGGAATTVVTPAS